MKRNTIVSRKKDTGFILFGRVSRVFPDGNIEVIDCGKMITVGPPSDFNVEDYKGKPDYFKPNVFHYMPSLRKLKQMATRYDKTVWKKHRKGLYCEYTESSK